MEEIPFYYGSAENKLNSKGQVAIPARFRSVLPDEDKARNYVVTRGEGDCLYIYTHRQFAKIKDRARQYAESTGNVGLYRRFMAQAVAVEIDTQGRFVLPQESMRAVGIVGPAIRFIGMDDRIEIWEPSVYANEEKAAGSEFAELTRETAREIYGM